MPSRPRSSTCCDSASPYPEYYSYIIMAEENGVCHVNGEPEVVDGDLQNGEPDDDDKGYDI